MEIMKNPFNLEFNSVQILQTSQIASHLKKFKLKFRGVTRLLFIWINKLMKQIMKTPCKNF